MDQAGLYLLSSDPLVLRPHLGRAPRTLCSWPLVWAGLGRCCGFMEAGMVPGWSVCVLSPQVASVANQPWEDKWDEEDGDRGSHDG